MQIKDLEDELTKSRHRQDQLTKELQLKDERVAALEQELTTVRTATQSRMQLASRTEITQLELLLDDELAKVGSSYESTGMTDGACVSTGI